MRVPGKLSPGARGWVYVDLAMARVQAANYVRSSIGQTQLGRGPEYGLLMEELLVRVRSEYGWTKMDTPQPSYSVAAFSGRWILEAKPVYEADRIFDRDYCSRSNRYFFPRINFVTHIVTPPIILNRSR